MGHLPQTRVLQRLLQSAPRACVYRSMLQCGEHLQRCTVESEGHDTKPYVVGTVSPSEVPPENLSNRLLLTSGRHPLRRWHEDSREGPPLAISYVPRCGYNILRLASSQDDCCLRFTGTLERVQLRLFVIVAINHGNQ